MSIASARAQDLAHADHLTLEEWMEEAHDIIRSAGYSRGSAEGLNWLLREVAASITSPGDEEVA